MMHYRLASAKMTQVRLVCSDKQAASTCTELSLQHKPLWKPDADCRVGEVAHRLLLPIELLSVCTRHESLRSDITSCHSSHTCTLRHDGHEVWTRLTGMIPGKCVALQARVNCTYLASSTMGMTAYLIKLSLLLLGCEGRLQL